MSALKTIAFAVLYLLLSSIDKWHAYKYQRRPFFFKLTSNGDGCTEMLFRISKQKQTGVINEISNIVE